MSSARDNAEAPQGTAAASVSASTHSPGSGLAAALVVFARLPVPGRVKTRLAAGVGADAACTWYQACAHHAIEQAAGCAGWADVAVYHSSADDTAEVEAWLRGEGLSVPCRPQLGPSAAAQTAPPPDLGAKMRAAMCEAQQRLAAAAAAAAALQPVPGVAARGQQQRSVQLQERVDEWEGRGARPQEEQQQSVECGAAHAKVIITGTDIPDVSGRLFAAAARALDHHDMVVGPSADGGYYMLGLTRVAEQLFEDMPWSTDVVLSETLSRAAAAGLRVAPLDTLPRLRDVDTAQDLAEWVTGCSCPSGGAGEVSDVSLTLTAPAVDASQGEWTPRKRVLLQVSRGILAAAGKQ
ncbi:hypothetical protein CHLRE_02g105700v5 [Chlamydomonas reinhardtii]|uniref:Glycosyltransferase n=1 Tax=Chlamydomonas reinhardtii TaxID=3055 RepID=A0A2K3E2L6_CHLRE|nr:uncharacterized protein CHLRE_02g105700v5 [Chlamydomonas reinhardtii]PNW87026.1 hypothetical protein CHLRE_02g105700v5 [Chlamydomonas reinhardtii]